MARATLPRAPRWAVVVIIALAAVASAACSADSPEAAAANSPVTHHTVRPPNTTAAIHEVSVAALKFMPQSLTVAVGTTVVWHFEDGSTAHNVAFDEGAISATLTTGTWSHHFTKTGTYAYRCTLHPFMTGRITVR